MSAREQAVGAVVLDAEGHVLLVRRAKPPRAGEWTLPGGRIEIGEAPADAAVREVREETGVAVRAIEELEVVVIEREGFAFDVREILCAPNERSEPRAGDDAADARWFSPSDLGALGVSGDAIAVIARARARARSC
jgi:mutator protein MutT